MSRLHGLRYRLRAFLRAAAVAREREDELRFHLELEAMHQRHAGVPPDDAPYAARRRLGNPTLLREEIRDMSARQGLEVLLQDVRYGLRSLRRAPGFAAVAVLTLALGIGATTAIFSVVNAVILRPLPYPGADRVTMIWMDNRQLGMAEDIHSWPNFADLRERNPAFTAMAAYSPGGFNFTGGCVEGACEPQRVVSAQSTADLFAVLGTAPTLGRVYAATEEVQGGDGVVVISHGLWTRHFDADPAVLGRTVRLNGRERTVIGVMPRGFAFPSADTDVWVPLALSERMRQARNAYGLYVVGRLGPDVSLERARAEMGARWARMTQENERLGDFGLNLVPLQEQVVGPALRTALWVILGAVAAVLLIGCANVANLLLSRATTRSREVSVRLALGASRRRLVRQLLTESVLLAGLGGALGVALAWVGLRLLTGLAPADIPRLDEVRVDAVVLGVALVMVVATGIVFGLVPALQTSRPDLATTLREGGRDGAAGRHGNRTRQLLAGAQLALVVVLLAGAGLLIRSFREIQRVDLGFRAENLLTLRIALPGATYQEDVQRVAFFDDVVRRVRALPSVQGAAATSAIFLSQTPNSTTFSIEGRARTPDEENVEVPLDAVTPAYFEVMGTPLVRGRAFTDQDDADAPPVVIINANMAQRFWGDEDPIGRRIKYGAPESENPWMTIVGVVADMRRGGFDAPPRYETFLSLAQAGFGGSMTLVVRTAGDPAVLATPVRGAVRAVDADLPVYDVQTMDQLLAGMVAQRRFSMVLLGTFAALALVLGLVGVYGVTSYVVAQRTREVGLRLALGAEPRQLVRLVVWQGMRVAAVGLVVGLAGAVVLARLMQGLLYGVAAMDVVTLGSVAALLAAATLAANYVPARRAARVDPLVALRSD